ncbi:MAG: mechanosensitive ion channel domain-containing protein [Bacteroidaceae bacterium]
MENSIELIIRWIGQLLRFIGVSNEFAANSERGFAVFLFFLVSLALALSLNRWFAPFAKRLVEKSATKWDDILLNEKVIRALCNLIPPLLLIQVAPHLSSTEEALPHIIVIAYKTYMTLAVFFVAIALIDALHDVWNEFERLQDKPIKGYIQLLKIIAYIITGIILISIFIGKSPIALLAGLGASAAILSLVFKDTLMGLIAGIQLSANDMLRKGDWITIPKHNINGVVEEITLITVKVRNFDETMLTVPPSVLISESFQNWRTMKEAGARRITRALLIDIQSVQFIPQDKLKELPAYPTLCKMLKPKEMPETTKFEQLEQYVEKDLLVNLTLFRLFLKRYLEQHQMVSQKMFSTVRELAHTSNGIPLELYFFTSDTDWGNYENIQADILDYVTALAPLFGLRLYQAPSGYDIRQLKL